MKSIALLIVLILLVAGATQSQDTSTDNKKVLTNVRVFDVNSGTFTPPQNIYIENGIITMVGIVYDAPFDGAEIDCSGKYAVPGLFDCHTHLAQLTGGGNDTAATALTEFVGRGVMYARDVGGPIDVISQLSQKTRSGEIHGPEIFYTGPMLEKSPLTWEEDNKTYPRFTVAVDSNDDVDSILPNLAAKGAQLVKTFSKMDTAVYRHLFDVANKHWLKIVHDPGGPLFHQIPMDWAIDLGVTSIEHAKAPWPVVLVDSLKEEHDKIMASPDPMTSTAFMSKVAAMGVESVSVEKLQQLANKMVERGVFLCPTLLALDSAEQMAIESSKKAMGVEELPEPMLTMIKTVLAGMADVSRLFVTELSKSGVRMLVGQDGIDPTGTFAEMRHLRKCGVAPAEIIKSATIYPATWLGVDDRLGAVAPKMEANFLIIEANPLEDLSSLAGPSLVIHKGTVVAP